MVQKTKNTPAGDYPSKATIIFYKNGPTEEMDEKGMPYLRASSIEKTPYYMEAELNSPMAVLGPGETYAFDTTWLPSRLNGDLATLTEADLVGETSVARRNGASIALSA